MAYAGKVALITGAGSGMGRVAARLFSKGGAKVAALDINETGLRETAEGHPGITPFRVDVTDGNAVENTVKTVETQLGPIDRVVNAAAIMPCGQILKMDSDTILRMMNINYGGLVHVSKATLPRMLERGKGDFISFSSMAGIIPIMKMGGYTATKFAVSAYTEVLYHENRNRGVRFACVCPPSVATPLLDQGRQTDWPKMLDGEKPLAPEEVIAAVETGLEKGEFWIYPSKPARIGVLVRRLFPSLIWKQVHQVEGW